MTKLSSKLILSLSLLLIASVGIIVPMTPAYADDGTGSWTLLGADTLSISIQDISFVDENNGWAGGFGIISTTNGGSTWTKANIDESILATNNLVQGISFFDTQNGVASTFRGVILYTDDGGKTWNNSTLPTSGERFYEIEMTSATDGWVVGNNILMYTEDGGVTWTKTVNQPTGTLYTLSFADDTFGFAAGPDAYVISIDTVSKDFTTLTPTPNGTSDNQSLYLSPDRLNAWIGDEETDIYHTSDGGNTWELEFHGLPGDSGQDQIFAVAFTDENNGWAGTDAGRIYATTDGGNYWMLQYDSVTSVTMLPFVGEKVWGIGSNGDVLVFTPPTGYNIPDPDAPSDSTTKKKSGGGCNDCTPPTLGLDINQRRVVDNGFSYNGYSIQAEMYHTPYPLINATVGEMNKVEIVTYENGGIYNMKLVQFGLGATEIGQPLSQLEVLIEVWLTTDGTLSGVDVDEIVIRDSDNLIDNDTVSAVSYVTPCQSSDVKLNCVKVDLEYSYREATVNNVMVVAVSDKKNNNQNFYFNDGIEVFGESLNEPPTYTLHNKQHSQQTEDLYLTLTRADKVNSIWIDENGVEYFKVSEDRFDRITPVPKYSCSNDTLVIKTVAKRNNICQFMPLLNYEIARAENAMNGILSSKNLDTIEQWDHNEKLFRQYK